MASRRAMVILFVILSEKKIREKRQHLESVW
jgi:hypothetical protein